MSDIGIDLGTTYSCVMHHAPDGHEEIIPSVQGRDLTPSVVYFDPDGSVLVGEPARKLLSSDPDNVVVGVKRHMGQDHPLEFHGCTYTPEAISGIILKQLVNDAAAHFQVEASQLRTVITVPAYFGIAEKEATYAAARIAEVSCMELVAEPVAAAYAYGADPDVNDCSLVFDLGGGTFDVAVVGMVDRRPRIWAVDGETQLGGLDWDRRLSDLIWQRLIAYGLDENAAYDENLAGTLLVEAELLKRNLSAHNTGTARIRYNKDTYTASVTRNAFEEATSDLVFQCVAAAKRVISTAHSLGAAPVSRVLLVGGSTRMPMIRKALESELSLPILIHDPDKAVARGAAVLASRLGQRGGIAMREVSDATDEQRIATVLSRAIGVKTHSSTLPLRPEPYVLNILPVNTPLPIVGKKATVATIMPEQETARIQLYEQAGVEQHEDLSSNKLVFDGEVTGIPPAPAGHPITLVLTVDVSGKLSFKAVDGLSGDSLQVQAFINGVVDEQELDEQRANVVGLKMLT